MIINGARFILQIKCAMASLRLPTPFVRFITHCVILAHKYTYNKKYYIYIYIHIHKSIHDIVINISHNFMKYTQRIR